MEDHPEQIIGPNGRSPEAWSVDIGSQLGATTTTWITDDGLTQQHAHTVPYPYTYTYGSTGGVTVDEETQMKRLIKEAIRELMEEDESFAGFLKRRVL